MAALITLAPTPIYGAYAQSAGIADQQLVGHGDVVPPA